MYKQGDDLNARPINEAAADALKSPRFHKHMVEYAEQYERLSSALWKEEFAEPAADESR